MDFSSHHQLLFNEPGRMLGKIHEILLNSSEYLASMCYHQEGMKTEITELGKEVGKDEIHWWVYVKEQELELLLQRTKDTLIATQTLKEEANKLIYKEVSTYEGIISILVNFINSHKNEIEILYNFVNWLAGRDKYAPSVLYTYRVWGTTRRSQRYIYFQKPEKEGCLQREINPTEVFCGLWLDGFYILDKVQMELSAEIAESIDPEVYSFDHHIVVPQRRLISQTSHEVLGEFSLYFEMLRNSMRNIIIDIEKYNLQKNLLWSDIFWERFIVKVRDLQKPESLWDFKKTFEMWHIPSGTNSKLKAEKELQFAEEIASIANSTGGVLLVGITDKPPRQTEGIGDDLTEIERKIKYSRDVSRNYLVYPRDILHFHHMKVNDSNGVLKNCLVIAIKQTCETVAVKDKDGRFTYPIRQETGLSRVTEDYIWEQKIHLKSDNFDFIGLFNQMLHDK